MKLLTVTIMAWLFFLTMAMQVQHLGKRSPKFDDGYVLREYEVNRKIVNEIARQLSIYGIKYHIITPEVDTDIALSTRAARANEYYNKYGKNNCLLISVHVNAAGDGNKWMNGRGWAVYTTKGVTTSDAYATIFFEEAQSWLPIFDMTVRSDYSDGDPDWEENFTLIYKTIGPAILTENLFQDNKKDAEFLRTELGINVIALIHVEAIKRICGLK